MSSDALRSRARLAPGASTRRKYARPPGQTAVSPIFVGNKSSSKMVAPSSRPASSPSSSSHSFLLGGQLKDGGTGKRRRPRGGTSYTRQKQVQRAKILFFGGVFVIVAWATIHSLFSSHSPHTPPRTTYTEPAPSKQASSTRNIVANKGKKLKEREKESVDLTFSDPLLQQQNERTPVEAAKQQAEEIQAEREKQRDNHRLYGLLQKLATGDGKHESHFQIPDFRHDKVNLDHSNPPKNASPKKGEGNGAPGENNPNNESDVQRKLTEKDHRWFHSSTGFQSQSEEHMEKVRSLTDLLGSNHAIPSSVAKHIPAGHGVEAPASSPRQPQHHQSPLQLGARTLQNMDDNSIRKFSSCPSLPHTNNAIHTTLVVQSSTDRAWILKETCRRWSDPIVAVLVTSVEDRHDEGIAAMQALSEVCPHLRIIQHRSSNKDPANYPVNQLRNLGLDAVKTSHVLVMDVDFVPSRHLDDTIRETIHLRQSISEAKGEDILHRQAIVVPAFERTCPNKEGKEASSTQNAHDCFYGLKRNESYLPETFEDLHSCTNDKDAPCIVFQSRDNWDGHSSTRSSSWLARHWYQEEGGSIKLSNGTSVDDIIHLQCFDSLRYEPYVVIPWCSGYLESDQNQSSGPLSPYYDERFHGYGKNKIEYIQHLRFLDYQFYILPGGFLTHNPHQNSHSKTVWLQDGGPNGSHLHQDMDKLYPHFLKELAMKYKAGDKEAIKNVLTLCHKDAGHKAS